jgi:hypothetical protein
LPEHDGPCAGISWELIPVASERQSVLSRVLWILLATGVVACGIVWAFRAYVQLGEQLSGLGDIAVADTRGEIRYKRGVPPVVYGHEDPGSAGGARVYYTDPLKDPDNALPEGADINSYHTWGYDNGSRSNTHLDITFDVNSGRVAKIDCIDQLDPPTTFCPALVGVGIGDPESRVTALLGKPTRQAINDNTGVKTMLYDDLGVGFVLSMQRVYGLSVVGIDGYKRVPISRFLVWIKGTLWQ